MARRSDGHKVRPYESEQHNEMGRLVTTSVAGKPTTQPESVLVIGSGPIVIGQAAEFDYAGTQACRALREDGVRTILVNSNPATIMTDEDIADAVYIEPLTPDVIRRVIQRERPDGLLPTLGGQTGLNLAVKVAELGILDQYDVRLLGTPLDAIQQAEDRALFKQLLERIGEPAIPSAIVTTRRGSPRVRRDHPAPARDPPRLHPRRHRRRCRLHPGRARPHRRPPGSTPARSTRSCSSAP